MPTTVPGYEDNRNLKNTLDIEGELYNVNAVEAERATTVLGELNVTEHTIENPNPDTPTYTFNGPQQVSLDIVPSSGGRFSGPIQAESINVGLSDADDRAILNYADIKNKVMPNLTGSPCYTCNLDADNNIEFLPTLDEQGTFNKVCIVFGPEKVKKGDQEFNLREMLKEWITGPEENPRDPEDRPFNQYLFINTSLEKNKYDTDIWFYFF